MRTYEGEQCDIVEFLLLFLYHITTTHNSWLFVEAIQTHTHTLKTLAGRQKMKNDVWEKKRKWKKCSASDAI